MNLTKKLEADILKLYNKYWDAYLSGKMKTMASLMDKNCHVIGSGMGEVFKNKKDAIKYYTATVDQIAGVSEMRNRNISVAPAGNNILVTEESDFYVLMEGSWTFYGQGRVSTLFGKTEKKWLIIQQHGSLPDSRTGGGEQVNTDKIKEENLRLKEAIKRRTIELENKSRELEIEASLERVRAQAMGMIKPEDLLNICESQFTELKKLGFSEIRNLLIDILNDDKGFFLDYDFSDFAGGSINNVFYNAHPAITNSLNQIRKGNDALSEFSISGKELDEWKKFRRNNGEQDDPRLENISELYYYMYSIGSGAIGISNFKPVTKEQLQILKRFRNVFDLAYRRYNDITLAEAQAREAEIELALERVRARTMAMHKGDELADTALLLFEQITELGIKPRSCGFLIMDEESESMKDWSANVDEKGKASPVTGTLAFDQHPMISDVVITWRKGAPYFIGEIHGKDLQKYYKAVTSKETTSKAIKDKVLAGANSEFTNSFYFEYGMMYVLTPEAISEHEIDIMLRFAKVFKQTYTRFLDLQKAEAQAREAKIEAALERVRSRTMGMQHSDELQDAAVLMFQQIESLGVDIIGCGFNIWDDDRKEATAWMSGLDRIQPSFKTSGSKDIFLRINEAAERGESLFVEEQAGEELVAHYQYMASIPVFRKILEGLEAKGLSAPSHQVMNCTFFSQGYLMFITPAPAESAYDIFKRFAKVFEQTYTRFLDLQKAEAQAREAQIELALERVRARTMAMQKSEELKEVIQLVYEQFVHLKINVDHTGFVVDYTPKGDWHFWIADEQDIPSKITHPYFESVWANQFNEAKEKGADFFATNLNFEDKNKFYNELLSYVPGLPEASKDFYLSCPGLAGSTVLLDNVGLYIENFSGIPYTDEDNKTLMRFGKVFQQTYTRFLDLQNAEAQAREAQIEASLERVRSRSLGMLKTDELQEVVHIVATELKNLGVILDTGGTVICTYFQDSKDVIHWTATEDPVHPSVPYYLPYFKDELFDAAWDSKNNGDNYFAKEFSFEVKNAFYHKAFKHSDYKNLPEEYKKVLLESKSHGIAWAWSKNSAIMVPSIQGNLPTTEEKEILIRFAKVFEQAYIRFMDLQKAEAQAREAQIEAALERVRSRSLAMHKSNELQEVVNAVFERLKALEIDMNVASIFIFKEGSKDWQQWVATSTTNYSTYFQIPYVDLPVFRDLEVAKSKGKDFYSTRYSFEQKNEWFNYAFEKTEYRQVPDERKKYILESKFFLVSFALSKHSGLQIAKYEGKDFSQEENEVLKRFSRVFEQAYIRFLDLQKAEAQAREAQIEAALERVRSKAMAMHKSDDLTPAVATVFSELDRLSFRTVRCGIGIFNDLSEKVDVWTTSSDDKSGSVNLSGNEVLEGHPLLEGIFKAWKLQKDYSYVLEGKDLLDYYRVTSNSNLPVTAPKVTSETTRQYYHCIMFPSGGLFAFRENEFSTEAKNLMRRFADVFQLTFTRHLDLRKAEAQNKIIQAENERKTKELEDARQLQLSMLPKELPQLPHLDIAVHMKTATEVGGDYYDFNVDANDTLTFVLGDATGHGMMSGMMVSIMKSFFISHKTNIELKQFFENANNSIKEMHLGRLMMSFMGLQITSQKVIATNAGMPSLIYFRNKSQKAGEFVSNNLPLGAMKGTKYSLKEINYEKGDTLLLMSDGFGELKNENNEQYGYPRIIEEFKSVAHKNSNAIVEHLNNSATEWMNGVEPEDDVTFVVIKVK